MCIAGEELYEGTERIGWCWINGSEQYTSIAGSEIETVGNLFFAGEHTSYNFQGYMNGGAVTGRIAANNILRKMGKESSIDAPLVTINNS